jgi:hypothetical protein
MNISKDGTESFLWERATIFVVHLQNVGSMIAKNRFNVWIKQVNKRWNLTLENRKEGEMKR